MFYDASPHTPTPNPDSQPDQAGPTGLGGEAVSGNFETSNQPNFSDSNNEDQGGGIFSTPELTVDSENVPDPNVISDDDKSRVATVFQKTDASARRHAIAEEMNEAALAAADIPSTATGDIKLPGGKKKHKKAPLIIILALMVLAVGGGFFAAWQMGWIGGGEAHHETALQAFATYKDYLIDGPSKSEDTNEESAWFLFTIPESELSLEQKKEYFTELEKRFSDFEARSSEKLGERLGNYKELFRLAIIQPSLEIYASNLADEYIKGGSEAAYNYIQNSASSDSQLPMSKPLLSALETYLDASLTVLEIYETAGCIHDNVIDFGCESVKTDRKSVV